MVPELIGIELIFDEEFFDWSHDEFLAIFFNVEIHNLGIGHWVSIDELLFIPAVFDGIKIAL